jgi:hypothetical protein
MIILASYTLTESFFTYAHLEDFHGHILGSRRQKTSLYFFLTNSAMGT